MVEGRVVLHLGMGRQLKSASPSFCNVVHGQLHIPENNTTKSLSVSPGGEGVLT